MSTRDVSEKLSFKGVAHPPPNRGQRVNKADLSAAEIATTNLGRGAGTPMLVEHDYGAPCGRVLASWEGRHGEMRVAGIIDDPKAIADVRSGAMRGLSLGSGVVLDSDGNRVNVSHDEVSICETPARNGCYIDSVNNKTVRAVECYSRRAGARPCPTTCSPQPATRAVQRPTASPSSLSGIRPRLGGT